jgi:hypothetical protein
VRYVRYVFARGLFLLTCLKYQISPLTLGTDDCGWKFIQQQKYTGKLYVQENEGMGGEQEDLVLAAHDTNVSPITCPPLVAGELGTLFTLYI